MGRIFKKKLRPLGSSPETIFLEKSEIPQKVRISVMEYGENTYVEKNDVTIDESLEHLENPSMTWVQVNGVSDAQTIASIGKLFKLHPLILEDIFTTGQRSKIDVFQNQVFIVIRSLQFKQENNTLSDQQVSLVFGPNYLVSFVEDDHNLFEPIKDKVRQGIHRVSKLPSDYLAYSIIDAVVDYYFIVLEKVDFHLDKLEDELVHKPSVGTIEKILAAKRDMIVLRKAIWPIRDVVNRFSKLEPPLVHSTTLIYMHDVYDHIVQMIDVIEGFRDVAAGMMDVYLSNINIRMNEIMKVLTMVSTIFVPLTFICSIYGMNFEYMPELKYHWGYPITLAVMLLISLGMLLFFRRKRWI